MTVNLFGTGENINILGTFPKERLKFCLFSLVLRAIPEKKNYMGGGEKILVGVVSRILIIRNLGHIQLVDNYGLPLVYNY